MQSLPSGCTADKNSASATVDNGIESLVFYVDCSTTVARLPASLLTAQVGAVNAPPASSNAAVTFEVSDCSQVSGGKHICKAKPKMVNSIPLIKASPKAKGKPLSGNTSLWSMVAEKYNNGPANIAAKVIEVAKANDIAIPEWGIAGRLDSRTLSASALNSLNW